MSLTVNSYNSISTNNAYKRYQENMQKLSSGKRINKAADDAAGLAIAKKLGTLSSSYGVATNNAYDMQNALNVADGGLSTITDSISRIRELSIQAANSTYTDSDRAIMQMEVDQLLDHIDMVGRNSEFNTQKLLDGTFTNKNAAVNPNGDGQSVSIDSSLITALGLNGYDISNGNIDLDTLDSALDAVTKNQANIGAQYNRLGHTINYNMTAQINLEASRSRIEDQDMAEAMMEANRNRALQQYQIAMQKKQMASSGSLLSLMA